MNAARSPEANRQAALPREGGLDYDAFLATKGTTASHAGLDADPHPSLFPFQADLVAHALRRGRSALFADTGLGKSRMEADFARRVAEEGRVLVLTPLAVAQQWVEEAAAIGVDARYARDDDGSRIVVTNYDIFHHFDPTRFAGVVLDESSILKSFSGATRCALVEGFRDTPYRLAATATPAPNDVTELGNHAEFLGILSRSEMLAKYFVHDGGKTQDWRLKRHAEDAFWRWVCGWGPVVKRPSDLGYEDGAFALAPLRWHEHVVDVVHADWHAQGYLFAPQAETLVDQRATRRATMEDRARMAAEIATEDDLPCIIWCELNAEADEAERLIPGAVQIRGSDDPDVKQDRLLGFARGKYRVLVTKPSIAGFGLNWQHCAKMVFLGASHSYEWTYQAIRRCWRFGQTRVVDVHVIRAATEQAIADNYRRKEADAARMGESTSAIVMECVRSSVRGGRREWNLYDAREAMRIPAWLISGQE